MGNVRNFICEFSRGTLIVCFIKGIVVWSQGIALPFTPRSKSFLSRLVVHNIYLKNKKTKKHCSKKKLD